MSTSFPSTGSSNGVLGLDRRAMEAARLARVAQKRKLEDDTPASAPLAKRLQSEAPIPEQRPIPPPRLSSPKSLEYPFGAIKKTWCFGYPRQDDIKIEEVLQRSTLKVALMSSWQLDFEWLASKVDLGRTKMILVMQSKDKQEQEQWRQQSKSWSKSLRLCFPPMGKGMGTMHSKLMLLFHPEYLRVVVPSANLVNFDWGETGVLENVLFLIDLPRLPEERQGISKNSTLTPFAHELVRFLAAMEVDNTLPDLSQGVVDAVMQFDFTNTKHLAFLHTIGGAHLGPDAATSTGYPLLASSVRALNAETKDHVQVDFAASSIGAITAERLETFFKALQGQAVALPTSTTKSGTRPAFAQSSRESSLHFSRPALSTLFNVYYPTNDTVQSSKGGPKSAGTVFMTPNFDKPTSSGPFPVLSLRDSVSTREGLVSHAKMIIARGKRHAIVYVGSANFSPSAWGTLTWDRKEKTEKLSANNWECGVLMKVCANGVESSTRETYGVENEAAQEVLPLSQLLDRSGARIPVPFRIPGKPYVDPNTGAVARPWIQK